jgi:putative DNA primase/helicase
MSDATIERALALGEAGHSVFPVLGKAPALPGHGFHDASTKRSEIVRAFMTARRAHPDSEIGIGLSVGPSGLAVIDVDVHNGVDGFAGLAALESEHGELADRSVVARTPSGGLHIYTRMNGARVGSRAGLAPGVDVRGDGGYVVVYSFEAGHDLLGGADLPVAPAWLPVLAPSAGQGTSTVRPDADIHPLNRLLADALIREHGGHGLREMADGSLRLVRPGKEARAGVSVSVGVPTPGLARFFTGNWPPFTSGQVVGINPDGTLDLTPHDLDLSAFAKDDERLPPPSAPLEVARQLVAERYTHDGTTTVRFWRGSFWLWMGSHWTEAEEDELRAAIYDYTEHATWLDASTKEPRVRPWSPTKAKVSDVLDSLRAIGHLPERVDAPCWLDGANGPEPGRIVACANGLLDLGGRVLRSHDPRLFNLVGVPFDYQPDAPTPERWLSFLEQLWPDDPSSIAALQEFLGYVVSGRIDLQKILLLVGPTRAGKGVIGRVTKALVGAGNSAGPTLASLGTNFGLAPLIGKPLAIVADARLGSGNSNQIVERLLSISGEDELTIDRKYKGAWTGTLHCRFFIISNELPRFGDASGAIANRFVILTLGRSFLGKENPDLTDDLLGELSGIFAWVLDGLDRLGERGRFTEPRGSADAIVALQDLSSPVSAFVRDECEVGPTHEVACDELFRAWRSWCHDNGYSVSDNAAFGRDLAAVVPGLRKRRPRSTGGPRGRQYVGVALRPDRPHQDPLGDSEGLGW